MSFTDNERAVKLTAWRKGQLDSLKELGKAIGVAFVSKLAIEHAGINLVLDPNSGWQDLGELAVGFVAFGYATKTGVEAGIQAVRSTNAMNALQDYEDHRYEALYAPHQPDLLTIGSPLDESI